MIRFALPFRLWLLALAALGGCRTPPPAEALQPSPAATATAAVPAAPASAPAPRPTLVEEQRRLAALFRGTPVVFTMQTSTVLRIDVPLRFCFERGQTAVKPALAAVLDRLAQSQQDGTSRVRISAAGDVPTKPQAAAAAASAAARARAALAARRAASVRDRLAAQGLATDRLAVVDGEAAGVRLTVTEPPAP